MTMRAWTIAKTRAYRFLARCVCAWCTGCAPDVPVDDGDGADAEVYARAVCENLCTKYEECAPVPESFGTCVASECVDMFFEKFEDPDEPCFVEEVELKRCWTERESCDEFFDVHLETMPGSVCYDFVAIVVECISAHQDDG